MKLPAKSIGIFIAGAAIASLPYTLSIGKANAQGTTSTSTSNSKNGTATSSAGASSSQRSGSSQNSSASQTMNQMMPYGQMGSTHGTQQISAMTNDEQSLYVAVGNVVYRFQKSKLGQATAVPSTNQPNQVP
jgi:hypothetical protein